MSDLESVSSAPFYDLVTLPFSATLASDPPAARAFIATVDGTVTLTRLDGVTVAIPVTAGAVYDLRFIAAEGDGPILAILAGPAPVSDAWNDSETWNDDESWT